MAADDLSDLFEPRPCRVESVTELARFVEKVAGSHLIYPGNGKRNIGYFFRGEIDFPVPLQPSLEREWFKVNSGEAYTATELLALEKILVEIFMREAPGIRDLATKHGDKRTKLPAETDVFEWLQLKQHYRTNTRLLDFTKDIRVALYFAVEHFCQQRNAKLREKGLVIYCLPCMDRCNDGEDNKSPFNIVDGPIDMNLAIGGQIGLDCMKCHTGTFQQRYNGNKRKQSFGWDRAYHPNPRLSFQQGMLAYPYETEGVTLERGKPSWFVRCLRMNPSDPFRLGSVKKELPPIMIRIPETSIGHCLEYVQDTCGLTPARIYLDCGRIGDRLRPESA